MSKQGTVINSINGGVQYGTTLQVGNVTGTLDLGGDGPIRLNGVPTSEGGAGDGAFVSEELISETVGLLGRLAQMDSGPVGQRARALVDKLVAL